VGPRMGLGIVVKRKISAKTGNQTLAVQPIASQYTDRTTSSFEQNWFQ
jgi:hypothetical protein